MSDGGQTVLGPESCSASLMSHSVHLYMGWQRQGPQQSHLDGPGIGLGGLTWHLSCSSSSYSTRKHMHAHQHRRRASLSACSTLLSPSLPSSFPPPPLTYYSVYAVTLTPQLQPQPYFPPNFLGLLFLVSPWVFQGFSCVVGFV